MVIGKIQVGLANGYLNRSNKLLGKKGLFDSAAGFLIWLFIPVIAIGLIYFLDRLKQQCIQCLLCVWV